jgi:hypothetical protein
MTDPKPSGEVAASGNFLVADGARLEGNFRCDGHARIGRAAVVDGALDVAGSLAVREKAAVTGAIACASDVDWHPLASAASLRSEGAFRLGEHQLAASLEAAEGVSPWEPKEASS